MPSVLFVPLGPALPSAYRKRLRPSKSTSFLFAGVLGWSGVAAALFTAGDEPNKSCSEGLGSLVAWTLLAAIASHANRVSTESFGDMARQRGLGATDADLRRPLALRQWFTWTAQLARFFGFKAFALVACVTLLDPASNAVLTGKRALAGAALGAVVLALAVGAKALGKLTSPTRPNLLLWLIWLLPPLLQIAIPELPTIGDVSRRLIQLGLGAAS